LSLSYWGDSVGVLKYLCETFGGYIDENDCDDQGFYPVNAHLHQQGTDFTTKDEMFHALTAKIGYESTILILPTIEKYIK